MKIAVVNNCVPFLRGGAEYLADALTEKLNEHGHQAQLVRIPFRWDPPSKIVESMLACRLLRLPNVDRVIALKFPAYFVPHPNKVLWMLHQFRQAYDLWESWQQSLPTTAAGREIRDNIMVADNTYLPEAKKIYTNSHVTSDRLKRFNGLDSEVLYPPLRDSSPLVCAGYGDYIFAGGRVNQSKRQRLLVEAVRFCQNPVKLIVAGSAEGDEADVIRKLIARYDLADRVTFVNRYVLEDEKIAWISRALGCAYIPVDEDSYGYVTLEAYTARKTVITCSDSGGIHILVKDRSTGLIAQPDPKDIARCFDELYMDRPAAQRLGESGHKLVQQMNINWQHVIRTLTA